MNALKFDWDPRKDKANQDKHVVSFAEARSAFYDGNAIEYYDPDHSDNEDRYLMIGLSSNLRVLLVCSAFVKGGPKDTIRIITARRATRKEQTVYIGDRT
ncbi:MAG: BrnT family toxin [Planctomycetota bacterium]